MHQTIVHTTICGLTKNKFFKGTRNRSSLFLIKMEREVITITIDREIWKKLVRIKLDKDFKTFDEVLEDLLKRKK